MRNLNDGRLRTKLEKERRKAWGQEDIKRTRQQDARLYMSTPRNTMLKIERDRKGEIL
jgi:hypothetical protein